jgi:hypothetical protein
MKSNAIKLAELHEKGYWTHHEMDEAAAELRAQDAAIERLIRTVTYLLNQAEKQMRPATRDEKIVNPGVYDVQVVHQEISTRPDYCGSGHCSCIECPYGMDKEPVAWADKHDIEREGHDFWVNRQQPAKDGVPLYAAPAIKEQTK